MKIIYQSFDGLSFDTREECEKYEASKAKPRMYAWDGKTDDVDRAYVVDIRTEAELSWFLAECDNHGSISEGIEDDCGVYIWDSWNERYHYLDTYDEIIKALLHWLRDTNKI